MSEPEDVYVFGCFGTDGHYLLTAARQFVAYDVVPPDVAGWCDQIGLPTPPYNPDIGQPEGVILDRPRLKKAVPTFPGWSFVSWWDRRGNHRGSSHTGILARGEWSEDALLSAGRRLAPWAFRVEVRRG